jgi:excinuclease UvrABC nuclease subunit
MYIILGANLKVLYIGKAGLLGKRLAAYFHYVPGSKRCKIVDEHQWVGKPQFVATIAVPSETFFEASAIEEYLINRLHPPNNTIGN